MMRARVRRARLRRRCSRARRLRRGWRSGREIRRFFRGAVLRFGLRDFFQLTFVDDVDGAFGPMTAISAVATRNWRRADVLGSHDAIGANRRLCG